MTEFQRTQQLLSLLKAASNTLGIVQHPKTPSYRKEKNQFYLRHRLDNIQNMLEGEDYD